MQLKQETKRTLQQISNKADRLREQGSMTTEDLARLRDALNRVASDLGEMVDSSLEDFFKSVGTSVISAQKDLDRQSRDYQASGAPLPTQFRIPRADAHFRFAISKLESERIGLLLYSSREQQETSQQHEVGFEVTAAPLSADQLAIPPMLKQAGIPLRELIRRHLASQEEKTDQVEAILGNFNHALCIGGENVWDVACTTYDGSRYDLDLVTIPIDASTENGLGKPQTVTNTTKQRQLLLERLHRLGEEQSDWLAMVATTPASGQP